MARVCGTRARSVVNTAFLYQIDQADQPARSASERLHRRMTYRAERYLLRRYPHQIAVSPRLAETIRAIAPGVDVRAIPFGLDFSLYPMIEAGPTGRPPTLGLIASFNWTPGPDGGPSTARPVVARDRPAGCPRPGCTWRASTRRAAFRDHLGRPGVTIDDRVTDVPAFFRGIDLQLYAPERQQRDEVQGARVVRLRRPGRHDARPASRGFRRSTAFTRASASTTPD